jgi:hypothetical protein
LHVSDSTRFADHDVFYRIPKFAVVPEIFAIRSLDTRVPNPSLSLSALTDAETQRRHGGLGSFLYHGVSIPLLYIYDGSEVLRTLTLTREF